MPPNDLSAIARAHDAKIAQLTNQQQQLLGMIKGLANVPRWIEEIPGKRQPHFEVIEILLDADSAAKKEGTTTVSIDGPFVCTGVALYFQKTSGAYANIWGPATAFGARIPTTGQQHGYAYLFDQPHCSSFTVEITAHGSERLWQSKPVASALYSPEAGGAYILPASHLFKRASTIRLAVTPDVSMPYSGKVQGIFLGYRILQGYNYQP
jgi:hypothetical protein